MLKILPPALLSTQHAVDGFDCGQPSLNTWLHKTALKNQSANASRCFVICNENKVIGYYCLSSGAISREAVSKSMQRNMPESLPIILMGRLAIDTQYHNKGFGKALVRDAIIRVIRASRDVGVMALLIHALTEQAKRFYLSCGFIESPLQPMTLIMSLKLARELYMENE